MTDKCAANARHAKGCDRKCGEAFCCGGCGREVGACLGADDALPELCDACWAASEHADKEGQ